MYADCATGVHFYVNEFAQTQTSNFFMPIHWISRNGVLCADAYPAVLSADKVLIFSFYSCDLIFLTDIDGQSTSYREHLCFLFMI